MTYNVPNVQQPIDLVHLIDTFSILNLDKNKSTAPTPNVTVKEQINDESYVISDADEELLILIGFKKIINLHSITIYSFSNPNNDTSAPKDVYIYKNNNLSVGFDDIKSMKPDKSVICSLQTLQKRHKQIIKLKNTPKFRRVQYCAVFIASNHHATESTFLNGIVFKGTIDDTHQYHNITALERPQIVTELNPSNIRNNANNDRNTQHLNQITIKLQQIDDISGIRTNQKPDNENTQQCQLLFESFKHISTKDSSTDSVHLLHSNNIRSQSFSDEKCELSSCQSKANIGDVLKRYNEYIYSHSTLNKSNVKYSEEKPMIRSLSNLDKIYSNDYNNVMLSMDFVHLLTVHGNECEDISEYLNTICHDGDKCNISTCLMMKRNHRDRHNSDKDGLCNMYFNETADVDIVKQQLLDSIHCFYFHTFDIGHTLTTSDKDYVCSININSPDDDNKYDDYDTSDKIVMRLNEIRLSKQNNRHHFERLRRNGNNKFNSVNNYNNVSDDFYSLGFRYFYWPYFKDNVDHIDPTRNDWTQQSSANDGDLLGDWFITASCGDFKEEMLQHLAVMQWNHTVKKACLKLKLAIEVFHLVEFNTDDQKLQIFNMKRDESISLSHIMALMFYCNYDVCNVCI